MDKVDDVPVSGLAQASTHTAVLAGVARGLGQLFPAVLSEASFGARRLDAHQRPQSAVIVPKAENARVA